MKRDHRLRIIDAQTVSFAPKTPWSDGTTHVLLSPEELIEKLEALVPPPRLNLVRAIMVFWRPTPLIGADRTRFEGGREPRFGQWRTHCPAAMLSFELGSTFCPSVSYRGDALSRLPRPHEAHCSNYLLCPLSALVVAQQLAPYWIALFEQFFRHGDIIHRPDPAAGSSVGDRSRRSSPEPYMAAVGRVV